MCQAYYSNCRGISTASKELVITCKERVYIFDWKLCEKGNTRFVCEPTFHSEPAGDLGQCEDCERIERQLNPGRLVDISSIYQVHCPSRKPPSYAPPPYIAPPSHLSSPVSSVTRPARAATASTLLQLPPTPQYAESPYADGSARSRNTKAVMNCTTVQQQPSTPRSLHLSAANDSSNNRAAVIRATIDPSSLLRPPPMPPFFESPYVCTRSRANNKQLQNLPPVAQTFHCRRPDDYLFDEGGSTLEPRVLGLRSQWYVNELHESQKPSPWKSFSGWIRKAGEKMAGQGRFHQGAAQPSRSEHLARQPRVKPQRAGVYNWVASSSNLDREERPVAWTY